MPIADVINEAKAAFATAGLDCSDGLAPPADDSEIDEITAELSLPVPPELRALYRVHGGQEYVSPGISGLFGLHRLLTLAELVSDHRMTTETSVDDPLEIEWEADDEPPYWDPGLLPFALSNDEYLCIHSRRYDVWRFRPYDGMTTRWPSIESVLREVIADVHAARTAKPSWKEYLPADLAEVYEWVRVEGFLPASCWYQLKARVSISGFQAFVGRLGLIPKAEHGDSHAPERDDHWRAQPFFEGDWWNPTPSVTKTFVSVGGSSLAKYENGFLYFKLWKPMTGVDSV